MPATLANPGEGGFAKTHFELVAENKTNDEFFAAAAAPFATRDRCGKNVRRVRRILLPVDVVVIHTADHEGIGQRRGNGIETAAAAEHGGESPARNFGENLEGNGYGVLVVATPRAADRVQKETFGVWCGVGD